MKILSGLILISASALNLLSSSPAHAVSEALCDEYYDCVTTSLGSPGTSASAAGSTGDITTIQFSPVAIVNTVESGQTGIGSTSSAGGQSGGSAGGSSGGASSSASSSSSSATAASSGTGSTGNSVTIGLAPADLTPIYEVPTNSSSQAVNSLFIAVPGVAEQNTVALSPGSVAISSVTQ
jgi:hypothetical protein